MVTHFIFPHKRGLQSENLHPPRGVAASGFRPLRIFLTAASRRGLARISVLVWLIILSDQLPVIALVGRYPTNKLIGHESLRERQAHGLTFLHFSKKAKRIGY